MRSQERVPRRPGADLHGEFVVAPRPADVAAGSRRGRGSTTDLPGRDKCNGGAAKRSIHVRLLPGAGAGENLVTHLAKGDPEVEAGRGEMFQQGGGEWAVRALAVVRRRSGLGREGNEGIRHGRLDATR